MAIALPIILKFAVPIASYALGHVVGYFHRKHVEKKEKAGSEEAPPLCPPKPQKRIAFCTTCKNRTQHLRITLPRNLTDNAAYNNCVFVILDYNSQDELLDYLRTTHGDAIHSGRLVVYSYREDTPFRMAHAKNMAHRLGILEGADILVNLDADNLTGSGFAEFINEQFHHGRPFLWSRMIPGEMPRGMSGRIVVHKHSFLEVGGYDEQFHTWGPDDKDFNQRLTRLGLEALEVPQRFLDGVTHNDRMRFREYPHVRTANNCYSHASHKPDDTIANWGKFGMGIVFRNFDWTEPIVLGPLPTRIWGIGMHKTATTSLHHALEILRFDSVHWKSAHWAKRVWREMNQFGRSPTLERNYAACDLPITLLYESLDKAYPGSKFILTMKDETQWLSAAKNHWDPGVNKFRSGWDNDPFTNRIHQLVYGIQTFDHAVFLERYRRHNAEVLDYFKDRPNDLLVMKMDEGAGWPELCNFLDVPVPDRKYPRSYSSY
jgi:hypothetical protein